ncbi:MAG TPA: energy transducer TonB [Terriglobia bacterium]|nr:energy transducer TonB [Terriglobia bacterium]
MFDETLLDSSPDRAPVLKAMHWAIAFGIGLVGVIVGYFALPIIFLGTEGQTLLNQSVIFAGVPFFFTGLMLCYTHAESVHLRLSPWGWFVVVLIFNLLGFILFLVYTANKTGDWKRATMPLAYIFEGIIVGVIVLIPLILTEQLPKAELMTSLTAPPPPPPPPPPAAAPPKVVIKRVSVEDLMKAPTVIPKTIAQVKDEPEPPQSVGVVGGVPGGVPGGSAGGVIGGIIGGMGSAPPPPPPPKPAAPKRIKIGGNVEAAKALFRPQPEYPQLAKMARIQGHVILHALISKQGTIEDLKALSGHPLLIPAAIAAVSKWRYQPYLLDGEPVEVETEIDVNFTLSE